MKNIVFFAIILLTFCLGGCKDKTVTTQYTIGCLGFEYGELSGSDLTEIESYLESHVEYNKLVSFEGLSLAENDAQARKLYYEQMEKVDVEHVCSLLNETDYFIYGIATLNASGDYRFVKATRFRSSGAEEMVR